MTCPCPCIRATDVSPSIRARLGGKAWNVIMGHWSRQIVGMVPPSMTYSLLVIEAAE